MTEQKALPTGLYEELLTDRLAAALRAAPMAALRPVLENLDETEAPEILAQYVYRLLVAALHRLPSHERIQHQIDLCNRLITEVLNELPVEDLAGARASSEKKMLRALLEKRQPQRPRTPLDQSALLVNAPREPSLAAELLAEIDSADAIDVLCSFVLWNGVRALWPALEAARERGVPVRVITTTYMGITQPRALAVLSELGAKMRVSYDSRITRLHAKAWLFERNSGFATAYIGSSNLSHSALHDGLEWNVRISQRSAPALMDRFRAAFEGYWADDHFLPYDADRFAEAIRAQRPQDNVDFTAFDVRPYPHQEQILEWLEIDRKRHDRWRNLVVAATGTGKTVIAALDYRRLVQEWGPSRLLFVAHRQEILKQSLSTFRHVMKDGSFGELYVAGSRPDDWRHVFASVQSLSRPVIDDIDPEAFDVVIIDEFHHAAAPTYDRILQRLRPRAMLGLTATPERTDGKDVTVWFDGHISAELRVWQAIDEGLLCPFQYFGVSDDTDLSSLEWRRGGYNLQELSGVYTGNDARVAKVLRATRAIVADPIQMRALGFCVSIDHANYMAQAFERSGIPALAVSGLTAQAERDEALRRLRDREVKVLFAVDLYNEGIDVPEIDTLFFLRPTESATVFLQQLGRGLRKAPGKSGLTVLDFIGQQHRRFRFDLRYRALTGATRSLLQRQIEQGFPFLPSGCHIQLDRVAQRTILDNVTSALSLRRTQLVDELRSLGDVSLSRFLTETGLELEDIYRGRGGWTTLRRAAGLPAPPAGAKEEVYLRGIARLLHVDDPERIGAYRRALTSEGLDVDSLPVRAKRLLTMLAYSLSPSDPQPSLGAAMEQLRRHPAVVDELGQVLDIVDETAGALPRPVDLPQEVPLLVHERYSRDEVLVALGESTIEKASQLREGVRFVHAYGLDVFFITLNKAKREFSPTTMYRDYAISTTLFHWESQSTTSEESQTGQRYINHRSMGAKMLLFARQNKRSSVGTEPYLFLGLADYVQHHGSRPMAITWKLQVPIPPEFFELARAIG